MKKKIMLYQIEITYEIGEKKTKAVVYNYSPKFKTIEDAVEWMKKQEKAVEE